MSPTPAADAVRRTALRLAIAADIATAASVAILATNALRPGTPAVSIALILVWAATPRIVSACVAPPGLAFAKGHKYSPSELLVAGAIAVALSAGVLVLGAIPGVAPTAGFETVLLAATWLVGFGLRSDGAYAVYEPLAIGAAIVSLTRGPSHGIAVVAATFAGMCLSSALRRQLAAAGERGRGRRVDLRLTWRVAGLAAVALIAVLLVAEAGLAPILPRGPERPRAGNPWRTSPRRAGGAEPSPEAREREDPRAPDSEAGRRSAGGPLTRIDAPSLRRGSYGPGPDGDDEVVLHVVPRGAGSGEPEAADEPRWNTLWKARTYVRFDARREAWTDEEERQWLHADLDGARLLRTPPDMGGPPATWQVSVVAERFQPVLLPCFTQEVRFEQGDPDRQLRTNRSGDLEWVLPRIGAAPSYTLVVRAFAPIEPAHAASLRAYSSASEGGLDVPAPEEAGLDLRAHAAKVLGDTGAPLADRIERLRSYFHESFRYASAAESNRLPDGLADFLSRKRLGNCQHYATAAALLLRASGVPARIVTGYAGAEREGDRMYAVWRHAAHAWIEILSEHGWVPVNPTEWVRSDPASADIDDDRPGGSPEAAERRVRERESPLRRALSPAWAFPILVAVALVVMIVAWRRSRRSSDSERQPRDAETAAKPTDSPASGFVPGTPAEHLLVDYGHLQSDLAVTGQERRSFETPREHAHRVSAPDEPQPRSAFSSLLPLLDDGLFGKADLTDADLARGREDLGAIKRTLVK